MMLMLKLPSCVGVPDIVLPLIVRPDGREPINTRLYGPGLPLTTKVWLKGRP
ncbi:hypothetical protein FQZ97_700010 [compost metagenome]